MCYQTKLFYENKLNSDYFYSRICLTMFVIVNKMMKAVFVF
jgi:hypothetical protein